MPSAWNSTIYLILFSGQDCWGFYCKTKWQWFTAIHIYVSCPHTYWSAEVHLCWAVFQVGLDSGKSHVLLSS